jgi:hypothetical protein
MSMAAVALPFAGNVHARFGVGLFAAGAEPHDDADVGLGARVDLDVVDEVADPGVGRGQGHLDGAGLVPADAEELVDLGPGDAVDRQVVARLEVAEGDPVFIPKTPSTAPT